MSKTKKIAVGVVSIVLASSMCVGMVACSGDDSSSYPTYTAETPSGSSQTVLPVSVEEEDDGSDDYTPTLAYSDGTSLSMNVGYQNTGEYGFISYRSYSGLVSGEFTLFGTRYAATTLKPAWNALSSQLNISFVDNFQNYGSDAQITNAINDGTLSSYNVITGSATAIVSAATTDTDAFLDLSLYLDYMPNFKAFLEENPVVLMSLTSNTSNGAMYYAPYFDGNDDIEKYELANKTWVEYLLDSATGAGSTTTFAGQAQAKVAAEQETGSTAASAEGDVGDGTQASVESYMGTTGSWAIESTDPDDTSSTVTIEVNYDAALKAAQTSGTALNTALTNAGVTTSSLISGNIVDLQNAAINATSGAVTGAQLLDILKAYIDVAYLDEDGNSYYETRSDVFNGYDAAWDVDLLVALSRCVVTNQSLLNTDTAEVDIYAISARQGTTQRRSDLVSLAGELYGVRGLTQRYEYAYIDSDGSVVDARTEESTYEALDRMNQLVEEGLIYSGTSTGNGVSSYYSSGTVESFMIYDYVQTQTANGGYAAMGITELDAIGDDYNFAPIVTPVSKWDDGTDADDVTSTGITYSYASDGSKYMRFTESWRSVKNTGFAIPYDSVRNNPEKLSAVLTFIDYLFSNDGQILMTYGPMSSNNDISDTTLGLDSYTSDADGFWYGTEVTNVNLEDVAETYDGVQYTIKDEYASQYFVYQNKVYTGTYYKGEMQPTMTTANLYFYYGYTVNDLTLGESPIGSDYALSYTNYARAIIGSALPIGNKLQSFEYQCTADCGIEGADIVAEGLTNNTIAHVTLDITNPYYEEENLWYTLIPTTLPYNSATSSAISTNWTTPYGSSVFRNSSSSPVSNFLIDIIWMGLDGDAISMAYTADLGQSTLPTSAAEAVALIADTLNYSQYQTYMDNAWQSILSWYRTNHS